MKYIIANYKENIVSDDYINNLKKINTDNKVILIPNKRIISIFDNNFSLGTQNIIDDYDYVLVGHHDYRKYDTDTDINNKIKECIKLNKKVILCVNSIDILKKDLNNIDNYDNIIIAYEPDEYIGTGNIIDTSYIINFIKKVKELYKDNIIIYGGGVTSNNLNIIKEIKELDGVLLGTSALNIDEFKKIILNY